MGVGYGLDISIALHINGVILTDEARAIPKCGNHACVNPEHLMYGDEARFWEKIERPINNPNGCWIWLGSKDNGGYGVFHRIKDGEEHSDKAHQYSWEYHNNQSIPSGIFVCHTCDVRSCVNPTHLFLGSHTDNMNDRNQKERQARGETQWCAILTEKKVIEMRELFKSKIYTRKQLSQLYGVAKATVDKVITRRTWRHLP